MDRRKKHSRRKISHKSPRGKVQRTSQPHRTKSLEKTWADLRTKCAAIAAQIKEKGTPTLSVVLPFLHEPDLLKWTEQLTKGVATVYDKAMDAEYLRSHIGGPNHRLFDGGHTIWGSWEAARNARPDDSLWQEVFGGAQSYMRDLTTVKGMPFFNLNKANYDKWADATAGRIPGVSKEFLYDLFNFDAMEVCVTGLSVVGVFFAFKQQDKGRVGEMLGAMGVSSIAAANPILGLTCVAVVAYSYWKHGPMDVASALKGGGITALSVALFSLMGLPLLVELVIVMVLITLLKKHIVNNREFVAWLKARTLESLEGPKQLLNLGKLTSFLPSPRMLLPARN